MEQYEVTGVRKDGTRETWQEAGSGTWAVHEGAKVKRPDLRIICTRVVYQ